MPLEAVIIDLKSDFVLEEYATYDMQNTHDCNVISPELYCFASKKISVGILSDAGYLDIKACLLDAPCINPALDSCLLLPGLPK